VRVVVIADTHVGDRRREATPGLMELAAGADEVVHLGDFTDEGFARELEGRLELHAVFGNCDPPALRRRFPAERVVEFDGVKVALLHDLRAIRRGLEDEAAGWRERGVGLVLFGHRHRTMDEEAGGVRFINPGTAGDEILSDGVLTAGVLEVSGGSYGWETVILEGRGS